jgi:hypothetical protein
VLQDVSLDPDVPDAGPPPTEEDDELAEGRHELEDLTLHVPGEFTAPRTDPRSGQPADAPAPEPSRPTDPPEPAPRSPGRSSPEPQQTAEVSATAVRLTGSIKRSALWRPSDLLFSVSACVRRTTEDQTTSRGTWPWSAWPRP